MPRAKLRLLEDLKEVDDARYARRMLQRWTPPDPSQLRTRDEIVAWIERYPDAHRRERHEGHLTASALVVDAARERALLTLHRKLGRWLQLGGHCEGDANLASVALREAEEESGIRGMRIDPTPLDVDIHVIPARPGEPEHVHLDTRFLVVAPEGAQPELGPESLELRWFTPVEVRKVAADASVLRLFDRVFGPVFGPRAPRAPGGRAGSPSRRPL